MELKSGYKQTEAGVVPEDWEVMRFFQAVGSYIDYRGRTPRKLGLSWGGGNILALSANNVQMGRIDPDKEAYYGSEELYRKWMVQGECELGDVLLTMEAPLGNVAQIPDSRKYILSQRVLLIKPKEWLLRSFLAHYLKGNYFQNQLAINSTGSTAKGIQRKKLDELLIYLPPTKVEQEAIAEALSDTDALIESLEQLIAKKHNVKQGTMQELLTGKKRLPGVSREWSKVRMREVLLQPATYGIVKAGAFIQIGIKMLRGGDIVDGRVNTELPMVSHEKAAEYSRTTLAKDDVVIALVGYPGASAQIPNELIGANISRAVGLLRLNKKIAPAYLVCYLNSPIGRRMVLAPSAGSAQQVVNLTALNKLEFLLPELDEQTAIATILNDMDAEIAALEAKLAKARYIKQGMIQELLTGRIRLL